jgi:ribosomal subunit interface protein
VEEKLGRLEKYFDGIHRLHVILDIEDARRQTVELVCTVARRSTLVAKGEAEDLYAAIDQAEKKLEGELKKYKAKLHPIVRGKKRPEALSPIGAVEAGGDEDE